MAKLVAVYAKDGQKHTKSLANARDLVTHAGWTWKPGHQQHPTSGQPYAGLNRDTDTKKRNQEILDRAKTASDAQTSIVEVQDELPAPQISFVEVDDAELARQQEADRLASEADGEGEVDDGEAPGVANGGEHAQAAHQPEHAAPAAHKPRRGGRKAA